jgi:2-succinyl-5-enolpyruvyl-6-hydroxy-3-cyclohexene-1-carboxylate synthase
VHERPHVPRRCPDRGARLSAATECARALIDELARNGVRHVVIAPGSRSAPLALAAYTHPGVALHVRIDERSAAFLALGITKAAGRPAAAVVCTSGTAAANLAPAVWEARLAGAGLIVLTADRPPELRDTGANQTIDQVQLYGSAVRWFAELGVAEPAAGEFWRSAAARACAEAAGAAGGPPGPVHLNCPFREPLVPGPEEPDTDPTGRPGGAPWTAHAPPPPAPAPGPVRDRLKAVRRGLVVAGDGAAGADRLAAALGWPLLAEPTSNARRGAHAIGTYHLLAAAGYLARNPPDLVVTVGKPGLSKPLLAFLASGVEHVVLDPHGRWWDPVRSAAAVVTAGAAATAAALESSAPAAADPAYLASWRAADRAARAAVDALLDATAEPTETRLARDLAAQLPAGALLAVASSGPVRDLDVAMVPRADLAILGNRGASGIDGFVSTALGAALQHGGPAAALAGDLSLLHDQNGLLLGPDEQRPDLVLVVANNDGGGIFHFLPQADDPASFERLFATPHGAVLADVAAAARCGFARVESAGALAGALADTYSAGGIHVVEVPTDRQANVALRRRLTDAVAATLA